MCVCVCVYACVCLRLYLCVCMCAYMARRCRMFPTTDGQATTNPRLPSDITGPMLSMLASVGIPGGTPGAQLTGSRWCPPPIAPRTCMHPTCAEWHRAARRLEWARERCVCAPREDRGRVHQARQCNNARSLPAGPRVRTRMDHPPVAGARPSMWMRMRMHARMKLRFLPKPMS